MQGNYHRQHLYLLQANKSGSGSTGSSAEYRQQQTTTMPLTGLVGAPSVGHSFALTTPTKQRGANYPQGSSSTLKFPTADQLSARTSPPPPNPRSTSSQVASNQFQSSQRQVRSSLSRPRDRDLCASGEIVAASDSAGSPNNHNHSINNNNHIQVFEKLNRSQRLEPPIRSSSSSGAQHHNLQHHYHPSHHQDQYASQIKSHHPEDSYNFSFMPPTSQQSAGNPQTASTCSLQIKQRPQGTSGANLHHLKHQAAEERPLRVNFNRSTQPGCDDADDEPAEGRKKKYLTAKYGQQQMNLIKKRLKIETWLYDQLRELAKETKCEADLEEIDIDLDQLLDMDGDDARRRWLKKTLEPFEGLPEARVDQFIEEVLAQARLL